MTGVTEAVRLYSIPDVADRLAVHTATVYRLIGDGGIRTVQTGRDGASRLRIRADDLQAFIDSRTSERRTA